MLKFISLLNVYENVMIKNESTKYVQKIFEHLTFNETMKFELESYDMEIRPWNQITGFVGFIFFSNMSAHADKYSKSHACEILSRLFSTSDVTREKFSTSVNHIIRPFAFLYLSHIMTWESTSTIMNFMK